MPLPRTTALKTAILALSITTLAGCATAPSSPGTQATAAATPEQVIHERAQQRWSHLIAKDFAQAYNYLTPAYRSLKTPEQYAGNFSVGATWKSAKVHKVACENAERCTATIQLEVMVLARGFNKPLETFLFETWLLDEGQWWFYEKN